MALTRQNLPHLQHSTVEDALKGGYVAEEAKNADITIVSTGSEVGICIEAAAYLKKNHNITARVVSMPCWEVFDAQPQNYRLQVFPDGIPCLSVEVLSPMGWERYSHEQFGLNRFGASGPYKEVYKVNLKAQFLGSMSSVVVKSILLLMPTRRNSGSLRRVLANVPLPRSVYTRARMSAPGLTMNPGQSQKVGCQGY
jgi:hypothetical protein